MGAKYAPKAQHRRKGRSKTAAGQVKRKVKREIPTSQEGQGAGVNQGQARTESQEGQDDAIPPPAKRMRSKIKQREIPVQVKSKSNHLNWKQIVEKMIWVSHSLIKRANLLQVESMRQIPQWDDARNLGG